jgi:hypothetical protein
MREINITITTVESTIKSTITLAENVKGIPVGGQTGEFLSKVSNDDFDITWTETSDTTHGERGGGSLHSQVTDTTDGFMSSDDKNKLDGIDDNANNYTLETHDNDKHTDNYATESDLTGHIDNSTDAHGIDSKAENSDLTSHTTNTNNPHSTTKVHIGLSNVDNVRQIPLSGKGNANGVATLGSDGKLVERVSGIDGGGA